MARLPTSPSSRSSRRMGCGYCCRRGWLDTLVDHMCTEWGVPEVPLAFAKSSRLYSRWRGHIAEVPEVVEPGLGGSKRPRVKERVPIWMRKVGVIAKLNQSAIRHESFQWVELQRIGIAPWLKLLILDVIAAMNPYPQFGCIDSSTTLYNVL